MICSWDVGIYNLSYNISKIVTDPSGNKGLKIIDWKILEIANREKLKKNKMGVFENLPKILDNIKHIHECSVVLIENQPCMKNPTMKSIQMVLYSNFIIKGVHNSESKIESVDFISASNKLKIYDGPELFCKLKSSYSKRKFFAVQHCLYFLKKYNENEYTDFFNSVKKKDDLADSYLQALYYFYKNILKMKIVKRKKKPVKKIENTDLEKTKIQTS